MSALGVDARHGARGGCSRDDESAAITLLLAVSFGSAWYGAAMQPLLRDFGVAAELGWAPRLLMGVAAASLGAAALAGWALRASPWLRVRVWLALSGAVFVVSSLSLLALLEPVVVGCGMAVK